MALGDFLRRKIQTVEMAVTFSEAVDVMELAAAIVELMRHNEIDTSDKTIELHCRMRKALHGIHNRFSEATYANPVTVEAFN